MAANTSRAQRTYDYRVSIVVLLRNSGKPSAKELALERNASRSNRYLWLDAMQTSND